MHNALGLEKSDVVWCSVTDVEMWLLWILRRKSTMQIMMITNTASENAMELQRFERLNMMRVLFVCYLLAIIIIFVVEFFFMRPTLL